MVQIKQNLVSKDKYSIKCPYTMTPDFIVVHNTANDATAQSEIKYMISNDNEVSFHFAVDDTEIVQGLPLDRNAWACGDGGSGQGNRKGIQVEICFSKSGGTRFDKAEKNASKLIAQLLHERGWDTSKVKKHQDFSGKYCPHRTLDIGWASFINMIKDDLKALKAPQTSSGTSNTPMGGWRVCTGYYEDYNNAKRSEADAKAKGFDAYLSAYDKGWRVTIGYFENYDNATNQMNQAKAKGLDAYLVPHQK